MIRRNARLRGDAVTRRTLLTGAAAGAVIAAGGNAFAKQTGDCDRLRSVLIGHRSIVSSAAFSPDARQIVTASYDTTARLWNAATGAGLNVLNGHTDAVYSASFSPDGKKIVTASIDGTARLWDALGGSVKVLLEGRSIVREPHSAPMAGGLRRSPTTIWRASGTRAQARRARPSRATAAA